MLSHLIRYIILSFIFTLSLAGSAQTVVDSLKSKLAEAGNLHDSIMLLYNIYDCSPSSLQGEALGDLYGLAMSRADYRTANDVLRQISDHYATNDSVLQVLLVRAQDLPDTPEKQSTLVYINVMATSNLVRTLTEDQLEAKLRDYLAQHTKSEEFDTYRRIEYLFNLCTYMRMSTKGELLTNYYQELQELVDSLPDRDIALKLLFYTQAGESYLSNCMIPETVEANKTMLTMMEELENQYTDKSRSSHNYDKSAFMCYYRLLLCHNALTPEEVDDYYSKIISLIDREPSFQMQSDLQKKLTIYHMMAKKRYADVIPLIKERLNDSVKTNTGEEQLYLIDALIKATEAVGDKENLLKALEKSNDLLKDRIMNKATESYKELQMIYEVNDLKKTNDELVLANQQIVINRHKEQLTYSVICLLVLVVLLVIVVVLYRRSKILTSNLTKSNAMIINERDALQRTQKDLIEARDKAKVASRIKTDFINNMSHEIRTPLEAIVEYSRLIADCSDADQREYLNRFADIITINTDLLITLVNDVLDLPSLENAKVSVHIVKTSVQKICQVVIDNVRLHIKPQIDLIFANEGQPDAIIMTDPRRVEQVLLNLLMNAAKFTDEGSITLEYKISTKRDKVTFTVTDTGIGIPQGKEDSIFSRFEKLNSTTQGNGLGLYISRLLAKMLGGSLVLDNEYRTGAKFIFTIPVS